MSNTMRLGPNSPETSDQLAKLESAEQKPSAPQISEIQENTRMAILVEKLSASKPAVEKVIQDPGIEEDRLIDKSEALHHMLLAAQSDGIDLNSLIITEEYKDKDGNLLKLEAKFTDEKTGNFRLYTYQIKRAKQVEETNVDVSNWDKDSDWPNSGEVLSKYTNGKWVILKK